MKDDKPIHLNIFMLMPFKEELTRIYEKFIKKPLENMGYIIKRSDNFFKSSPIIDDILESIENADIIIADLTGNNPNVFYELGRAHEKNKVVIQICQKGQKIPFDLGYIRTIIYDNSLSGYMYLQHQILKYVETCIIKLKNRAQK